MSKQAIIELSKEDFYNAFYRRVGFFKTAKDVDETWQFVESQLSKAYKAGAEDGVEGFAKFYFEAMKKYVPQYTLETLEKDIEKKAKEFLATVEDGIRK